MEAKRVRRVKIPKFKSIEEERRFWDTHSVTDFLDELEFVDIKFVKKKPMVTLSFRIEESKAKELKELAKRMNIPYTVLIREIVDKALEEARR